MHLLIVLVNYHGHDLTIDCLKSLQPELDRLPDAEIGLCDNGSGEKEVQQLSQSIAEFELDKRLVFTSVHPNRGFTGGNNAIIRTALESQTPPDAVMLLNNDTIVQPGAISKLVEFLERNPQVAVCGSRLEYPDGESQRAARRTLTYISEFESYARIGLFSKLLQKWTIAPEERGQPHECGWVPGAALIIKREVLESVGLLDEDLYTYFDDVDYCLRAKRAGWPTWFVPESRIVHLVGKTTGITTTHVRPKRRPGYWFWARRHYFLKNFGPVHATCADIAAIMGLCFWKLRLALSSKPNPDPPYLLTDLLRHSVFRTGFKIRPVTNPAAHEPETSQTVPIPAASVASTQ